MGTSSAVWIVRAPPQGSGGLLSSGTTEGPSARAQGLLHFGIAQASPHGHLGILPLGTTQASAALTRGPPSLWCHRSPLVKGLGASFALDRLTALHRGPHRMGARASLVLGPPRAPPQVRRGVHRVWITKGPAADVGAAFALGQPRTLPKACWALLCFGSNKASSPRVWGPPSRLDHLGPHGMGMGASLTLQPPRPSAGGHGCLLRFGIIKMPSTTVE